MVVWRPVVHRLCMLGMLGTVFRVAFEGMSLKIFCKICGKELGARLATKSVLQQLVSFAI